MSYALVRQAILERKGITAHYHGYYREMCPHVIGTKRGREQALCYQFGGQSSSGFIQPDGSPDNWRCIVIADLSGVQIVDVDTWHTAADHSRPQTCVDFVDVEVRY
jgi:hypothetical protein